MMLDWRPGQPIDTTRLTVPIETVRAASLSDTYRLWLQQFDDSDETLQLMVNNGVPLRTSTIIDKAVIATLQLAGVEYDIPARYHPESPSTQRIRGSHKALRGSACMRSTPSGMLVPDGEHCVDPEGKLVPQPNQPTAMKTHKQYKQDTMNDYTCGNMRSMLVDTGAVSVC